MRTITSRRVVRYYYNGKGYSTLRNAARAVAKDELRDEVLGVPDLTRGYSYRPALEEALKADGDFKKACQLLYGRRFPHLVDPDCREDTCWTDDYGKRFSEVCRAAEQRWLAERTRAIQESAGEVSK